MLHALAMSKLSVNCFGVMVDGFGAGPGQNLENPLGVGGMGLRERLFRTRMFQRVHGGGGDRTTGVDNDFWRARFCRFGAQGCMEPHNFSRGHLQECAGFRHFCRDRLQGCMGHRNFCRGVRRTARRLGTFAGDVFRGARGFVTFCGWICSVKTAPCDEITTNFLAA
jgi:hypothetical protein